MDLLSKLAVANVFVVLSAMYASRIIPKLQPGFSRLLAALPVVVVNFVVPQMFDRVKDFVMRGNCLLILTWLANFKARSRGFWWSRVKVGVTDSRQPFTLSYLTAGA